mmetsp:Transcript_3443/g.5702  ORF Transcript_3443/g.5702 Transcript_3443/m.5702 type:complete len:151 (+) Transcript_3443:549-1001(+)
MFILDDETPKLNPSLTGVGTKVASSPTSELEESIHSYTNCMNKIACHIFISQLSGALRDCATTRLGTERSWCQQSSAGAARLRLYLVYMLEICGQRQRRHGPLKTISFSLHLFHVQLISSSSSSSLNNSTNGSRSRFGNSRRGATTSSIG